MSTGSGVFVDRQWDPPPRTGVCLLHPETPRNTRNTICTHEFLPQHTVVNWVKSLGTLSSIGTP